MEVWKASDHRMLRYMAGIRGQDRVCSADVAYRCGVVYVKTVLRRERVRWFGHVKREGEETVLGVLERLEVEGRRPVGRPRKMWRCIQEDLALMGLNEHRAEDRVEWRKAIKRPTAQEVKTDIYEMMIMMMMMMINSVLKILILLLKEVIR